MSAIIAVAAPRLAELEVVIDRGLRNFVEVGLALMEIRGARLYRETHRTFESYCVDRWKFKAARGRQLIAAAELARDLQNVTGVTLANEREARECIPLARASGVEAVARRIRLVRATPARDRKAYQKMSKAHPHLAEVPGALYDGRAEPDSSAQVAELAPVFAALRSELGSKVARARVEDRLTTIKAARRALARIEYELGCSQWMARDLEVELGPRAAAKARTRFRADALPSAAASARECSCSRGSR